MKTLSLAFLSLIAPLTAFAQRDLYYPDAYGWGMMGSNSYGPLGWGMFAIGALFMILFWGLVLFAFVRLVQWLMHGNLTRHSARRILDERYAKGEISAEEYAERKKILAKD